MNTRHAEEFLRAIRNHKYEIAQNGLFFPAAKVILGGHFEHSLNKGPWIVEPNIVPTEGMNYLLETGLRAGTAASNWYIAPFAANVTPGLTLTAATFTSTTTEFTSYSESTRQAWTPAAAASSIITNTASPATVTINSGGQTSMYGAGLLSASAKSATTGYLAAAVKFATARTGLANGDTMGLKYTITASSS